MPARDGRPMSRATPAMRALAKRLIAHEAAENKSFGPENPAAFLAADNLRPYLAALMGNGGVRVLLSRSLVLAAEEVPWLRAVHINADGSFDGLEELGTQVDPAAILDGRVVLHAQLLGLLAAFIGENLTLGLLREAWPRLPLDNLDFGGGGK